MERKARNINDQRYKSTHELIQLEYRKLLREKSYREISVTEVCQAVHINRGTFYLHYRDAAAVMEDLEDQLYHRIIHYIDTALLRTLPQELLTRQMCEYLIMTEDGRFLGSVLNGVCGTGTLADRVCDYICTTVSCAFASTGELTQQQAELFMTYLAGGALAVMRRWHRNDYRDIEEEHGFCNMLLHAAYRAAGIDIEQFNHFYQRILTTYNTNG